jgi:hypothetical protein
VAVLLIAATDAKIATKNTATEKGQYHPNKSAKQ